MAARKTSWRGFSVFPVSIPQRDRALFVSIGLFESVVCGTVHKQIGHKIGHASASALTTKQIVFVKVKWRVRSKFIKSEFENERYSWQGRKSSECEDVVEANGKGWNKIQALLTKDFETLLHWEWVGVTKTKWSEETWRNREGFDKWIL